MAPPDGLTVPPVEVRTMIEKTAGYVHRNGKSFEQRIRGKEAENYKFHFLLEDDPYYGYYEYVLKQMDEGTWEGDKRTETGGEADNVVKGVAAASNGPVEPAPYKYTPPELVRKISPFDLNAIKLAAQFVAVKGDEFVNDLLLLGQKQEDVGVQLAFLEEGHSMYPIFEWYLESYRRILNEGSAIAGEVGEFDQAEFLNRCFERAEWEQKKADEETKETEKREQEQLAYASIDWQQFVVVETVEFSAVDEVAELGIPLNRSELEYRSLVQKRAGRLLEEGAPDWEDTKDKETNTKGTSTKETGTRGNKGMKILPQSASRLKRQRTQENYDPVSGERLLRCPLTNRLIAESKYARHIQILLRDPKYQEEKARYEAKFKHGTNEVSSEEIYRNMEEMFGSGGRGEQAKRQKRRP